MEINILLLTIIIDFLNFAKNCRKLPIISYKIGVSTPILTNLVGVHPRNIQTKFNANPCSSWNEEVKQEKHHMWVQTACLYLH